jgi:hypothetical protein
MQRLRQRGRNCDMGSPWSAARCTPERFANVCKRSTGLHTLQGLS